MPSSTFAEKRGPLGTFFADLFSSASKIFSPVEGEESKVVFLDLITPTDSQKRMVKIGLGIAAFPAALMFGATTHFHLGFGYKVFWSICAYAAAMYPLLKSMPALLVPLRYTGVGTINDMPVEELYSTGKHPRAWNEGIENVYTAPIKFDPTIFTELALDGVGVSVDAYFMATIKNPYCWLKEAGPDTMNALIKEFISKIRLFISNWNEAVEMIAMRDLLAEFLSLPCDSAVIKEFQENKLDPLTEGEKPMLTKVAVKAIIADAGKFCADANKWGYEITTINTEDITLPARLLAAAEDKAALKFTLANQQERQAVRLKMITEMKEKMPDLPPQDAVAAVDMLIGLAVKKEITEVNIRGLEKVIDSPVAKTLAGLASKYLKGN